MHWPSGRPVALELTAQFIATESVRIEELFGGGGNGELDAKKRIPHDSTLDTNQMGTKIGRKGNEK
jgi:hypothetical protein